MEIAATTSGVSEWDELDLEAMIRRVEQSKEFSRQLLDGKRLRESDAKL